MEFGTEALPPPVAADSSRVALAGTNMREIPNQRSPLMHSLLRHSILPASIAALALSAPTSAQQFRGGDTIAANRTSTGTNLFVINPAGVATPMTTSIPVAATGLCPTSDGDLLVVSFDNNGLYRIDPAGNVTTITLGLSGPLRVAQERDGNILVTDNGSASLVRVDAAGQISTVASGAPLMRPFDVMIDGNGDPIICDDRVDGLFRITQTGAAIPIATGSPFRLPQGSAFFPNGDYAVFDGLTDSVFRVDRSNGTVTTWVSNAALGGNPCGIDRAFDGGFVLSQSSASQNQIVRVDAQGNAAPAGTSPAFSNLEDLARMPHLTGPLAIQALGAATALCIDSQNDAGMLYTVALSLSVHPGVQLLANDPRAMAINADAFFFGTFLQNAPPFLNGFVGLLDSNGRVASTIDLTGLPRRAFIGLPVHAQGLTFTPGAVAIRSYTNYLALPVR